MINATQFRRGRVETDPGLVTQHHIDILETFLADAMGNV